PQPAGRAPLAAAPAHRLEARHAGADHLGPERHDDPGALRLSRGEEGRRGAAAYLRPLRPYAAVRTGGGVQPAGGRVSGLSSYDQGRKRGAPWPTSPAPTCSTISA